MTACSAPTPAGLFHPADAHGVQPFRAFSSRGAVTPSGARCPPDVRTAGSPRPPRPASSRAGPWPLRAGTPNGRTETGTRRLQGFAPLGSSLPSDGGLDRRRLDALMGFCLSRDPALAPDPAIDTGQLPWASRPAPANDRSRGWNQTRRLRSVRRAGCASLSRDRPSLLRSPTFSRHSVVRVQQRPEVIVSPRAPSHVAALRQTR